MKVTAVTAMQACAVLSLAVAQPQHRVHDHAPEFFARHKHSPHAYEYGTDSDDLLDVVSRFDGGFHGRFLSEGHSHHPHHPHNPRPYNPPYPPQPPRPPAAPPLPPRPPPTPQPPLGAFVGEALQDTFLVLLWTVFVPLYLISTLVMFSGLIFCVRRGGCRDLGKTLNKVSPVTTPVRFMAFLGARRGVPYAAVLLVLGASVFCCAYILAHGVCAGVLHCPIEHWQRAPGGDCVGVECTEKLFETTHPWTSEGRPWTAYRDAPTHGCVLDSDCYQMADCGSEFVGCGSAINRYGRKISGVCTSGSIDASCAGREEEDAREVRGNPRRYDDDSRMKVMNVLDGGGNPTIEWCWHGRMDRRCGLLPASGEYDDLRVYASSGCAVCEGPFSHLTWFVVFLIVVLVVVLPWSIGNLETIMNFREKVVAAAKRGVTDTIGVQLRRKPKITFHMERFVKVRTWVDDSDGGGSYQMCEKRKGKKDGVFKFDACDDVSPAIPADWLAVGSITVHMSYTCRLADAASKASFQAQWKAFKKSSKTEVKQGEGHRFWVAVALPGTAGSTMKLRSDAAMISSLTMVPRVQSKFALYCSGSLGTPFLLRQKFALTCKGNRGVLETLLFIFSLQSIVFMVYVWLVHTFVAFNAVKSIKASYHPPPEPAASSSAADAEIPLLVGAIVADTDAVDAPVLEPTSAEPMSATGRRPSLSRQPTALAKQASNKTSNAIRRMSGSLRELAGAEEDMPPLVEMRDLFVRELGVDGVTMVEVVNNAATAVGLDLGKKAPLKEKARKVWDELGKPSTEAGAAEEEVEMATPTAALARTMPPTESMQEV